jgi:integrase
MRFLSWPEVEELAANTREPYGNLVQLAALTGLRQGELFALRASAIDFVTGIIAVTHTLTKGGEFERPKTVASRRQIDLSDRAQNLLREQLLARVPNELDLVFPSAEGFRTNADNFRHRVFAPACKRSRLDGFRFHDLRHTYAALMVRAGAYPKYLQVQMGHSSIR